MTLYGPGYLANGDSVIAATMRILNQLVENLIAAGVEPVPGSVSDGSVAADAAIAQSKIAGLVASLAALEAADDAKAGSDDPLIYALIFGGS